MSPTSIHKRCNVATSLKPESREQRSGRFAARLPVHFVIAFISADRLQGMAFRDRICL